MSHNKLIIAKLTLYY